MGLEDGCDDGLDVGLWVPTKPLDKGAEVVGIDVVGLLVG